MEADRSQAAAGSFTSHRRGSAAIAEGTTVVGSDLGQVGLGQVVILTQAVNHSLRTIVAFKADQAFDFGFTRVTGHSSSSRVVVVGNLHIAATVKVGRITEEEATTTAVIIQAVAFQVEAAEELPTVEAELELKVVRNQVAWWEELGPEAAVGLEVRQRGL